MNKITYETFVKVYIQKKFIGTIKPMGNGWQYFPKGAKLGSESFPSIESCKRSLEVWNG